MISYISWPLLGLWMIAKERPDVIIVGEQNMAAGAAWAAKRLLKTPYIHLTYAEELTTLAKRPMRKLFHVKMLRDANAVVTVCEYTRMILVGFGVRPQSIVKILPAVAPAKRITVPLDEIRALRAAYGLRDADKVVLTVGALVRRKGHLTVMEALALLRSRRNDIVYVIAGGGNYEAELREHAVALGISDRVRFVGRVDDGTVVRLYDMCDVFVLAHRQLADTLDTEGCPTVFLEASARGRPVIGGNAGGVADAILDGVTGFVIDGTDPTALAERLQTILDDRSLATRIGAAGMKFSETLTPERNARSIMDLCAQVKARRRLGDAL